MKRKTISLILCLCMIFSLFGGFQNAFASEEKGEYIVYLDVEKQSPGYEEAYLNKDYGKAISLADEALDYYESEFKSMFADIEVISRAQLLVPSLCVRLNKSDLDAIKVLDYVKDIFTNDIIREPDVVRSDMRVFKDQSVMTDSIKMVNSHELIGNDEALQKKYNGAGSVLAIIDSNMDPSHDAFRLSPGTVQKLGKPDINSFLTGGKLSLKDNTTDKKLYEDVYRSEKVPFGWNYNTNSKDLNPEDEIAAHGQHVSGTVAGNTVDIDGKTWRGVAPEAQLLMMNVMRQGSTSSNIYIRAMQDAIVMGADAVNMSLGSTKGLPGQADGLVGKAINNGYAADTNFVIAAGNEGEYQGELNIDNPDFGTMASPGIATNAITVASLENKTMYVPVITHDGTKYIFQTAGDVQYKKGDYYLVDCGNGVIKAEDNIDDFKGKDLRGKVALIKRGGNTFSEKVLNAEKAGAIGAIIYNNVEGDLYMSVSGNKIPAIAITLGAAENIKKDLSKPVSIDMRPQEADNPQFGELSSFTNWGLAAGGYMKPDITAPGGHIYSTQTKGNTFGDMSGTSMATPHVTGAIGVIRARLNEILFAGETHKAALTKTILMNSAVPHVDPKTHTTTSPRRQGAGVMNLTKASKLDFTAVDRDTKIASKFVGNVDNEITLNLTIHNYSSEPKTLTPSVQATIEARDGKKLLLRPDELFSKTYEDKKVTVPAQRSVEYDITFPIEHLEKVEAFTNGAFVEGFLHLRDQNGMEISFPFVSFKGSYDNIPSIEKPVYDFDFETEKPMYWDLKLRNHDWYFYSTNILTNKGTYTDKNGKTFNNIVIAGIKNFDDIDAYKAEPNGEEPKPEFGPIVISPNADGYNDIFGISMVMTRTATVKASIIDEAGKSNDFNIGLKYSNISTDPDNDKNREQYLGFTLAGNPSLKDYADGKYTLRLKAAAVKAPKESYPETHRDIPFTIDTIAPSFENSYYDKDTRTLTFEIKEEGSSVEAFDIKDETGKALDFIKEENRVTLVLPEGKELSDIFISARDLGHNYREQTAEMLVFKDRFGKLIVNVNGEERDPLNLKYKVVNEEGKEFKNHEDLIFGKYKLIITDYSSKYEYEGEKEIPFEISEGNKEKTINLNFKKIITAKISVRVRDKADLEWADFDIFARNVKTNKVTKFNFDEGEYGVYYDAYLAYGGYDFYAEFKNGKTGFKMKFDEDLPFTVNSKTEFSTITASIISVGKYKVNITSNLEDKNIKYLAQNTTSKEVFDADEIQAGTWRVYPEKMPDGYYLDKAFETVTLTEEKPEVTISFNYQEIGDKKFTFNIKDDYQNAKYMVYDYYGWIGSENGIVRPYKAGIILAPGTYYVKSIADKEKYGETLIVEDIYQDSVPFKSVTEPVEIEYKWTSYADSKKNSVVNVFVDDFSVPYALRNQLYTYILKGTKGDPIEKTFGALNFSSWRITVPYDYYQVEIKDLPKGYTLENDKFIISTSSSELTLKLIPEGEKQDKVSVNVSFTKDGKALDDVKFKLDDEEFTNGTIEVAPGEYNLEILNPSGLVPSDKFKVISIDKNTTDLAIELEDAGEPEPDKKGTLKLEVYESDGKNETPYNKYTSAWAKGIKANEIVNNFRETELPYGKYTVTLSTTPSLEVLYDMTKSTIETTVTIDDNNSKAVAKLVLVKKGAAPDPGTEGKGTITYDVFEQDNNGKRKARDYANIDGKFASKGVPIEVDFGEHTVEISSQYWNIMDRYDEKLSTVKKTVTVDKDNPNVSVELVKVVKGTNITPDPEPKKKGTVKFEVYEYDGTNETKSDMSISARIGTNRLTNDTPIELDYGSYEIELTTRNLDKEKYDLSKTPAKQKFTIDEDNKDVVVKYVLYLKEKAPAPEPEPNPDGKGTLKFEVYESDGTNLKLLTNSMMAYLNDEFINCNQELKLSYGEYNIKLFSTWNMSKKYDEAKSKVSETVTLDAKNNNIVVKFILVLKKTEPTPDPDPQVPTKGTASWDYEYNGNAQRIFPSVKLYRVVDGKDELVNSFAIQNEVFTLDFGKYAFVIEPSVYPKLEYEKSRIEFELTKENSEYKAIFKISDAKETQKIEVTKFDSVDEDLSKVQFRVFDLKGNEIRGVKKTATGFEFPAAENVKYKIVAEGNKNPYFPTQITANPKSNYPPIISFTQALNIKVNSLAGDKEIDAKYSVEIKGYRYVYTEDLNMVPYIPNATTDYTVKLISHDQAYKLVGEDTQTVTVKDYSDIELTFNFERNPNVEPVNKEELKKLVSEYDNIKKTDAYKNANKALVDAYDKAIAEAKAELAKALTSQEAINALVDKVTKARDAIIGSMENLKKAELKKLLDDEAIVKAKDIYKFDTAEDKKAYDDAITKGNEVYEDANASEEAIDKAIADIKAALKKLDGYKEADKTKLKELLDGYNDIYKSIKYNRSTEKEREAYQDAIIEGTNIFNNKKASQEEIDAAIKAIKDAINGLSGKEELTEKTDPVTLEQAYLNDKYVRGTGIIGATVYYRIIKKGQNPEDASLRTGMLIQDKDGKFAISPGQIVEGDVVIVYQQERNKLMSDGVEVKILALDKNYLEQLVNKAEEVEKTDKFKYANESKKTDLTDAIAKAKKVLADPNANKEEIKDAESELERAIKAIDEESIASVTITFHYNDGDKEVEEKVLMGQKAAKPNLDPVRKGYKFLGWYADEELTEEFDFNTIIEDNTDIYAKWEEIIHLVTFDPANGEATWTERVRECEKVNKPETDPVWANHTFIAWQFDGKDYDFNTSVMANMMLIAKWEENKVEPQPQPEPKPYEPYEPYEPYRPDTRPYRPSKPSEPSKPINNNEDEKPVETKKDYGIITEYPINPVELRDVPAGPEGEAVRNLVSYGIIKGMGNGMFQGNKTITRAMVTRVFMLISKDKAIDKDVYFSDVTNDKWYAESVKWAASKGIIAGYTDGTFKPEKKVTRQEFCVMLNNLLKANDIELETVVPVDEAEFAKADDWAKDAMIAMKRAGLVNVEASGKFGPQSKFTREELAKTIDLLIKLVQLKEK